MKDITLEEAEQQRKLLQPVKTKGKFKKFLRNFLLLAIVIFAIFIWWKYFYAFGTDGVKSGTLIYVVNKGQVFKTYEGKLNQLGIKSQGIGVIQSNEFEFSIKNKRIFDLLKMNSGKFFDLQYKEYNAAVPWRGNTVYVVDSVLSMKDVQ